MLSMNKLTTGDKDSSLPLISMDFDQKSSRVSRKNSNIDSKKYLRKSSRVSLRRKRTFRRMKTKSYRRQVTKEDMMSVKNIFT